MCRSWPKPAEAGLPGYEYESWMGVVAPAATPAGVVQHLYHKISGILNTDKARTWFASQGADPGDMSAEAFTAFVREEYLKAGLLIRKLGLRAE